MTDVVPAATFDISGIPGLASLLDANNAINYSASQLIANGGRVTVDNFEPIEFSNKTALTINAGSGSDEINLNNPNTPTNLTSISVDGGDPGGSDTVIVNGTTGADTVTFTPTAFDSATITGAGPVPISVDNTEQVIYANPGGADSLTANGTSANDTLVFNAINLSGTFRSLGSPDFDFDAVASVTMNGGGAGFDTATIEGDDGVDTVTSTATAITLTNSGNSATLTIGTNVDQVIVKTFGGNDNINLNAFTALPTQIDAGDGDDTIVGSPQVDVIDGGPGNDTMNGGSGNDTLRGGDGNDRIDGDAGADVMIGGNDSDTFVWDPGDGSDLIEGEDGAEDTLLFNGNAGANAFILSANPADTTRLLFNFAAGAVLLDVAGVERVTVAGGSRG